MPDILADIGTRVGGYLKAIHDRLDALEAYHPVGPDQPLVAPSGLTATINPPPVLFAPTGLTAVINPPAPLLAPSSLSYALNLPTVLKAPTGLAATVNVGSSEKTGEASTSISFTLLATGETSSIHSGEASTSIAFTLTATGEVPVPWDNDLTGATMSLNSGGGMNVSGASNNDFNGHWGDNGTYHGKASYTMNDGNKDWYIHWQQEDEALMIEVAQWVLNFDNPKPATWEASGPHSGDYPWGD